MRRRRSRRVCPRNGTHGVFCNRGRRRRAGRRRRPPRHRAHGVRDGRGRRGAGGGHQRARPGTGGCDHIRRDFSAAAMRLLRRRLVRWSQQRRPVAIFCGRLCRCPAFRPQFFLQLLYFSVQPIFCRRAGVFIETRDPTKSNISQITVMCHSASIACSNACLSIQIPLMFV